jgi:hypothetical protein
VRSAHRFRSIVLLSIAVGFVVAPTDELDVDTVADALEHVHERVAYAASGRFVGIHRTESVQIGCRDTKIRQNGWAESGNVSKNA